MNLKSIVKKVESKEVLTCILLIIIGYMTAQLFMRRVNGFNVGGQSECQIKDVKCKLDGKYKYPGGTPPDICNTLTKESCNDSWYENTNTGGTDGKTRLGSSCKWVNNNKCVTPGTGFKPIDGCPIKSCSGTGVIPVPAPAPVPAGGETSSWNCNAYKCVNVSGTDGTYTSESECQSDCVSEKYSCSGSTCIKSPSGSYSSSNCDKKCGFSCSDSTCIPGSSGSDTYNTIIDCQSECESRIWPWFMLAGFIFLFLGSIGIALGFDILPVYGISFIALIGIIVSISLLAGAFDDDDDDKDKDK